jgi:aryl-alcohol dehydrogenase-like predicted oxidoreductase
MPALALGTVQFGLAYGVAGSKAPISPGEARDILEYASSVGVTRLDTAPAYGDIEQRLGAMLAGLNFEVVSKLPALDSSLNPALRTAAFLESMARSQERLGGALKGVIFHSADAIAGQQGDAAWNLVQQAADRAGLLLGCSYYDPNALAEDIERLGTMAMAQLPGSALDQRLNRASPLLAATEITARSAFLQGLLLMEESSAVARIPWAQKMLRRWHEWCCARGVAPIEAALSLAKGLKYVDYVVVGVDSLEHLQQIVTAWQNADPAEAPELACEDPLIIDPRLWKPQP